MNESATSLDITFPILAVVYRSPPARVLTAFGIDGTPEHITRATWATPTAILKPVEDEIEAIWIADLASRIEQRGFRLARPISGHPGRWVVDGWSAWERVAGEHRGDRWPELLQGADAFHEAVARIPKPEFVDRRTDRWRIADRLAWGEISAGDVGEITHLDRLVAARRPLSLRPQLVHGDLVGNVLFADGLPPAIIDLSLYWRPVGYGAALVAADAMAWEGASNSILDLIGHVAEWRQLLVRAVIFRVAVSELARRVEPWRNGLAEHYRPLVEEVIALNS